MSSHEHDSGSRSLDLKKVLFLLLLAIGFLAVLLVLLNLDFIVANIVPIAIIVAVLYLIARFDYVVLLKDYERAVVFSFGKVNRVGGPGWFIIVPPIESYNVVDLRVKTIDVPRQEIVTKDNVEIKIDAVIYLKVRKDNASVINSIVAVDDYIRASELFVISLIRAKMGKRTLEEIIAGTEELDAQIKEGLAGITTNWGVEVEEATIKDIDIPPTVLDAMHEQKAAVQKKLARVEQAFGHKAEIEAVKEAAASLTDTTLAYYYIKALEKLGEGQSSKIIFPMELTNLARSLTKNDSLSQDQLENLMEKYAPLVKSLAGEKNGKASSKGKFSYKNKKSKKN